MFGCTGFLILAHKTLELMANILQRLCLNSQDKSLTITLCFIVAFISSPSPSPLYTHSDNCTSFLDSFLSKVPYKLDKCMVRKVMQSSLYHMIVGYCHLMLLNLAEILMQRQFEFYLFMTWNSSSFLDNYSQDPQLAYFLPVFDYYLDVQVGSGMSA